MNHIVIGASLPFALGLVVYLIHRGRAGLCWLMLTPLGMAAGALWAVVPDLPRLWGDAELYHRLAQDPQTNIFFWHYRIDQVETDTPWWGVAFVLMVGCMFFVALRELRRQESAAG